MERYLFIFKIVDSYSGGMIVISATSIEEALDKISIMEDYENVILVKDLDGKILLDPTDEDTCTYPFYNFVLEKKIELHELDIEYDFTKD